MGSILGGEEATQASQQDAKLIENKKHSSPGQGNRWKSYPSPNREW